MVLPASTKDYSRNHQLRGRQSKHFHKLDEISLERHLQNKEKFVFKNKDKVKVKSNKNRSIKCASTKKNRDGFNSEDQFFSGCVTQPDIVHTRINEAVAVPDVLANDIPFEGATLVMQSHTEPSKGSLIEDEKGVFTYIPNLDFVGEDSYQYTVLDGLGETHVGLVTIMVDPMIGELPKIVDFGFYLLQGTELKIGVNEFVEENADLKTGFFFVESCNNPVFGSIEIVNDEVTYTPIKSFTGIESITCTIKDVDGADTMSKLTLEVVEFRPTNDLFTIEPNTPFAKSAKEGILINDSGFETGSLVLEGCSKPNEGNFVSSSNGSFTYTPPDFFKGVVEMKCFVSNGSGLEKSSTLEFVIGTMAFGTALVTQEDTPLTVAPSIISSLGISKSDGSIVPGSTVKNCENPNYGVVALNGDGTFTYVPQSHFNGKDAFECDILRPDNAVDKIVTNISVTAVGDSPIAFPDIVRVDQNSPASFNPVANDIDPDKETLHLLSFSQPNDGTLTRTPDGNLRYLPNPDFLGTDEAEYTITDGSTGISSAKISFVVNTAAANANTDPVANDDDYKTAENTPLSVSSENGILSNDSDPDGDSLVITSFTQPLHGDLSLNQDGSFVYTADLNWVGVDLFSYLIFDGLGTDTGSVSIVVSEGRQGKAKANPDFFSGLENNPLSVPSPGVLANDKNVARFVGFTQPDHGTLIPGLSGDFIYVPDKNFVGVDSFKYTIVDDQGNMSTASVSLTMKIVELPPLIIVGSDELIDISGSNSTANRVSSDCKGKDWANCTGFFGL